jgi:hypothetical protein
MHAWLNNFKLNSNFTPLEHDSATGGKVAGSESAQSIIVKIDNVDGLTIP